MPLSGDRVYGLKSAENAKNRMLEGYDYESCVAESYKSVPQPG